MTTIRTAGNRRPYEFRPSDHLAAGRSYRDGPLQPMTEQRKGLMAWLRK